MSERRRREIYQASPIAKYELLREQVLINGIVTAEALREPARATRAALLLVHTADYVDRFVEGRLAPAELRRLGFPWSPALVERSLRAVGGTGAQCAPDWYPRLEFGLYPEGGRRFS